jgi:internalin A
MSVNHIIDLTPIATLSRLRALSAIANRIVDLTPLLSLKKLQFVSLIGNRLSTTAIRQQVPALRENGAEVVLGE